MRRPGIRAGHPATAVVLLFVVAIAACLPADLVVLGTELYTVTKELGAQWVLAIEKWARTRGGAS